MCSPPASSSPLLHGKRHDLPINGSDPADGQLLSMPAQVETPELSSSVAVLAKPSLSVSHEEVIQSSAESSRCRKRKSNSSTWKASKAKAARSYGLAYTTKSGKAVQGKSAVLSEVLCSEKCPKKCSELISTAVKVDDLRKQMPYIPDTYKPFY